MKNNYSTKLQKTLPICRQIHSKSEIWKAVFEHSIRWTKYGGHPMQQRDILEATT
jgi:hypothetical protein